MAGNIRDPGKSVSKPSVSALGTDQLSAYLSRIGLQTLPACNLEGLHQLQFAHVTSIPFENLDVPGRNTPSLVMTELVNKLVNSKRGGYCFEQNLLFEAVLKSAGFTVCRLAARVLWHLDASNLPNFSDAGLPRTHLVLLVSIDACDYIVDVGFGGLTPPQPISFKEDVVQQTSHEDFQLLRQQDHYVLQARMPSGWKPLYVFDLQAQQIPDLQMMNWWVSTHASSRFLNHLIMTRVSKTGRYVFQDDTLISYPLQGEKEKAEISTPVEVSAVLKKYFGVDVSDDQLKRCLTAAGVWGHTTVQVQAPEPVQVPDNAKR